jgi:hypothetical protein
MININKVTDHLLLGIGAIVVSREIGTTAVKLFEYAVSKATECDNLSRYCRHEQNVVMALLATGVGVILAGGAIATATRIFSNSLNNDLQRQQPWTTREVTWLTGGAKRR